MARGFGTTLGGGTTDKITTSLTAHGWQRSYSLWTYRAGEGGNNVGRMFDKRVAGAEAELLYNSSTGIYLFYRIHSTQGGYWSTQSRPAANEWHHVLVTYDAGSVDNNPVIYFDGVSQTVDEGVAPVGTPVTNTDAYILGNRGSDNARNWDGHLAEFAVWDSILTSGNAVSLAAKASPMTIGTPVAYFPIWGLNSPEVDLSGTGYTGTVTGTLATAHPWTIRQGTIGAAVLAGVAPTMDLGITARAALRVGS